MNAELRDRSAEAFGVLKNTWKKGKWGKVAVLVGGLLLWPFVLLTLCSVLYYKFDTPLKRWAAIGLLLFSTLPISSAWVLGTVEGFSRDNEPKKETARTVQNQEQSSPSPTEPESESSTEPISESTSVSTSAPTSTPTKTVSAAPTTSPSVMSSSHYMSILGRIWSGVKVYYGAGSNKSYAFEIIGGGDCPSMPGGRGGVKVRYPDGTEEWKDRKYIAWSDLFYVLEDDPAISASLWYEYKDCP